VQQSKTSHVEEGPCASTSKSVIYWSKISKSSGSTAVTFFVVRRCLNRSTVVVLCQKQVTFPLRTSQWWPLQSLALAGQLQQITVTTICQIRTLRLPQCDSMALATWAVQMEQLHPRSLTWFDSVKGLQSEVSSTMMSSFKITCEKWDSTFLKSGTSAMLRLSRTASTWPALQTEMPTKKTWRCVAVKFLRTNSYFSMTRNSSKIRWKKTRSAKNLRRLKTTTSHSSLVNCSSNIEKVYQGRCVPTFRITWSPRPTAVVW